VLDYRLGGRDISEVLAMSVTEAEESFGAGKARTPAAGLARLGPSRGLSRLGHCATQPWTCPAAAPTVKPQLEKVLR
jgi:hypothetical protein